MNKIDISKKIDEALDYMQNDTQKAIEIFDEILEIDSQNIEAINGKGSSLMKLNRMNEAEKYFNYSLSINENSSAYINKGLISKKKKEYELALNYYNKAIQLNPDLNNIITILKKEIIELMDGETEIKLSSFSLDANNLIKKGITYKKADRLWDALDCYTKAIEIDSECKNSVNGLINQINTILQNEFVYETPQNSDSKTYPLKIKSLRLLLIEENPKQALVIMNQILEENENDLSTLNEKGCVLFMFNEYDKSAECFDKCLSINEKYEFALFNKGIVLRRMNMLKEALACFDKLIKMDKFYNKVKPYQLEILDKIHESEMK